ncbi:hypothetical protein G6O67_004824 [Ophiocordyceps sinensis]|uniref:Protein root UVB sensitive/RUS domain-containing protein n=2 Tax=Ophiocordyceps sinensis TaxID=72228 RepID=A0A8H4PQ97_9HYPO|nr:DUF647 domain-containing protein [Ophiocordyceps sinensis CO18]KAF4508448.1 hypothetical protein G6O67_004824 [Ophiocordyceps sinensis]
MDSHRRFELSDLYPREPNLFKVDEEEDLSFAPLVNSGRDISVVELSKSGYDPKLWLHSPARGVVRQDKGPFLSRSLRGWRKFILSAFLPVDFPNSVSDDYLAYQTYDSLQAFFSTITSLLASRALLQGLGVGDANSSATYAMLLTILRDAISNIATIVFAHRFGLRIEPEAKKYRFLADVFNDTAFFLELCSPYLSFWGKAVAMCTGEALRAVCGVAAGASKAALSLHFAKNDNLSELSAKEASQETAVSLIGLLVGTIVVRLVQDPRAVVCLVIALVLGHLWTNYRGVRCVHMNSLNKQRASILFEVYMESRDILRPNEVAEEERILFWNGIITNSHQEPVFRIDFAKSYAHAVSSDGVEQEIVAVDGPMHTRFVRPYSPTRPGQIKILLWDGAEPKHAILAWFMAMDTAWMTEKDVPYGDAKPVSPRKASGDNGRGRIIDEFKPSARDERLWTMMKSKGWDLGAGVMETGPGVRLGVRMTKRKNE